ncbi:MAG: hypothetical protein R2726_04695 [Acidimicrobiales bacterium]
MSGLLPTGWTGAEVLDVAERHQVVGEVLPAVVQMLPDPSPAGFAAVEAAADITGMPLLHRLWTAARHPGRVDHDELVEAMAWAARAVALGTTQVLELSGLRPATWAGFLATASPPPTLLEHRLWHYGWRCMNEMTAPYPFTGALGARVASVVVDRRPYRSNDQRRTWISPAAGEVWSVARQAHLDHGAHVPATLAPGWLWSRCDPLLLARRPVPDATQIERLTRVQLRDALDDLGLPVPEWSDELLTAAVAWGTRYAADLVAAQELTWDVPGSPHTSLLVVEPADFDEGELLARGFRPFVSGSRTDDVLGVLRTAGVQAARTRGDEPVGWARAGRDGRRTWRYVLDVAADMVVAPDDDLVARWRRVVGTVAAELDSRREQPLRPWPLQGTSRRCRQPPRPWRASTPARPTGTVEPLKRLPATTCGVAAVNVSVSVAPTSTVNDLHLRTLVRVVPMESPNRLGHDELVFGAQTGRRLASDRRGGPGSTSPRRGLYRPSTP